MWCEMGQDFFVPYGHPMNPAPLILKKNILFTKQQSSLKKKKSSFLDS